MNKIKHWKERMDDYYAEPEGKLMRAASYFIELENEELRAALAARATPAQPVPVGYVNSSVFDSSRYELDGAVMYKQPAGAYKTPVYSAPSPASDVSAPSPSGVGAAIRALEVGTSGSKGYVKAFCHGAAVMRDAAAELAEQVQGQQVPEGWQLVPKEPTPEMIAAFAFRGDVEMAIGHAAIYEDACEDYAEMLAAAPAAPSSSASADKAEQRHVFDWLHLVETKIGTPSAAQAARVLKEFYEGAGDESNASMPGKVAEPVATIIGRTGDNLRVGWLRPEMVEVGAMLYAAQPDQAQQQASALQEHDGDKGSALYIAREALRFYANQEHFMMHQPEVWDTVSGEPQNFYEDEAHTATVEDGSVAKNALNQIAGAKHKAPPHPAPQQAPKTIEQERADFEEWYTTHAFDYEAAPIGSRDCALQWSAWIARAGGAYSAPSDWKISPMPWGISQQAPDRTTIAKSLASMVIDWIEDGKRVCGETSDWKTGLPRIIEKRLARLLSSTAQPLQQEGGK